MGTVCSSNCYTPKTKLCFQHSLSLNSVHINFQMYPKNLITKIKLSQYSTLQEFLNATEQTSENIEYLSLSYKHATDLNESDMAHIYKELAQFKNLKLFKLNLSMKKISQRCLKLLMRSLKKIGIILEFIDMDFYGIEKIQVQSLLILKIIIINKEQGLPLICDCLQTLKNLTYLSLNLGKINDEGIESLCSVLTCLPLLTYLNLNLRENIELSNYNSLFKAILGLKYLYHLGVLIMQRNFSEDEFKRFIRDVVTKLKFLKSVHFEHNGFDISVKNCRNFYSLGDFTQLVKVKIILVVLIYDELESVRNIQRGFSRLKNLEEIEIYFNFKPPSTTNNYNNNNESFSQDSNNNSNNSESQCSENHSQFVQLFKELSENPKLQKCKISINEDDVCDIDRTKNSESATEK